MPFGLKKAPRIYQRLVDNALYGYLNIGQRSASDCPIDVVKDGELDTDRRLPSWDVDITLTTSLFYPRHGKLCTKKWNDYLKSVISGICLSASRRVFGGAIRSIIWDI